MRTSHSEVDNGELLMAVMNGDESIPFIHLILYIPNENSTYLSAVAFVCDSCSNFQENCALNSISNQLHLKFSVVQSFIILLNVLNTTSSLYSEIMCIFTYI